VPEAAALETTGVSYVYSALDDEVFLRADGSGVLYVGNRIRNTGDEPISSLGWCFWYGPDVYSSIYAEDERGYLDVVSGQYYSDVYGYGLCAMATLRAPLPPGDEYWYGLGVTVADHHTVLNDVISAGWTVIPSTSIERFSEKVAWPYNHLGVSATPTPDELQRGYARWIRTSTDVPWEFSVSISVNLSDQMAVNPLSQGILPWDGVEPEWEDDPYGVGTGGDTIAMLGCLLTSGTMAMNYFAQVRGFHAQTDPGALNTWMSVPSATGVPRGYAPWSRQEPTRYSRLVTAMLGEASQDLFDSTGPVIAREFPEARVPFETMRLRFQDGYLGILNVARGNGHYVLATGYADVGGIPTVLINDPYENLGSTTLLSAYNNEYISVTWYSPGDSTARLDTVRIYADCPLEMLITDQEGRRTGKDPRAGEEYAEIPGALYWTEYGPEQSPIVDEGTKILEIPVHAWTQLHLDLIGTGSGAYLVQYEGDLFHGGTARGAISGVAEPGKLDSYDLSFVPELGFVNGSVYLPMVLH